MNKCHSILEREKMNSIDMQTAAVLRRELNTNRDDNDAPKEVVEWLEKRVKHFDEEEKKIRAKLPPL